MIDQLIGKKLGMTQIFDATGTATGVTVIELGPNYITQIKTAEGQDGYTAVQLGFEQIEEKRLNQPERGHLKKKAANLPNLHYLREVRSSDVSGHNVGDVLTVEQFNDGDLVDITGISKGKGFAGVVKRHHFSGGPKTHGQSDRHRRPGSIGSGTTPGRVLKNLRMAGRMGNDRVTVQNLKIVRVDADRNLLLIKGAIPGANNGLVMVRRAVKGQPGEQ